MQWRVYFLQKKNSVLGWFSLFWCYSVVCFYGRVLKLQEFFMLSALNLKQSERDAMPGQARPGQMHGEKDQVGIGTKKG